MLNETGYRENRNYIHGYDEELTKLESFSLSDDLHQFKANCLAMGNNIIFLAEAFKKLSANACGDEDRQHLEAVGYIFMDMITRYILEMQRTVDNGLKS